MGRQERFEYTIDVNDVIVHVNDAWRVFASENDGMDLGERVVGSWLWQHIAGLEVKNLYRILLERVRKEGKTVRVPFRCDAPDLRRDMMLEVKSLPGGAVHFSSWVLEESERPRIDLLDAQRDIDPTESLQMCAWCKRIGTGEEGWQELEDALAEVEIFSRTLFPKITHAVCPDCQAMVLKELAGVG